MSVKANWHVELSGLGDDDDPFGPAEVVPIERRGKPIDLQERPALNQRLVELINAEAELFNAGITCAIRDAQDTCCSACPIRHTDELDDLTPLCRLGVEQERLLTTLAILHARDEAA